jgi:hypothetical protein
MALINIVKASTKMMRDALPDIVISFVIIF